MKEKPILFSAPMVRAILDGTKTQTRRVVRPSRGRPIEFLGSGGPRGSDWNNPECWGYEWHDGAAFVTLKADPLETHQHTYPCPYGQPGDRLWVRETWGYRCSASTPEAERYMHTITYRADDSRRAYGPMPIEGVGLPKWRERDDGMSAKAWDERMTSYWRQWRPSIHMPRWASRITLEVTGVRAERLQAISEADAKAEGAAFNPLMHTDAREAFMELWKQINGPGSWDANPWVWVVDFQKVG